MRLFQRRVTVALKQAAACKTIDYWVSASQYKQHSPPPFLANSFSFCFWLLVFAMSALPLRQSVVSVVVLFLVCLFVAGIK